MSLNRGSAMGQSGCHDVIVKVQLALECGLVGINVMLLTVEDCRTSVGAFSACTISKMETIGAYYGSLVCIDLSEKPLGMHAYGEGTMEVAVDAFNRPTIALHDIVTDRCGVEHSRWILAEPICATGFIGDARYLLGDTTPTNFAQLPPRFSNFFQHKMSSIAPSDPTHFRTTAVVAEEQMVAGEEFFVELSRAIMFCTTTK